MPDWRLHPLRKYDSVKRWLDEKASLTDDYKYQCLDALDRYCQYRQLNPDQLIMEYVEASKLDPPARLKPKDMLTKWSAHITEDGKVRQFWAANLLRRVLPFYEANGCPISLTVSNPKAPARESTTRATQALTRRFIEATPHLDYKWAMLCMAESGMRPGSVCKLQYRNLSRSYEAEEEPLAIEIPGKITKTGQSYFAFNLSDARKILTQLLENPKPDTRIVHFTAGRLEHYVADLGVKLKVNPPAGLKPFTCGSWREWVQNAAEGAGIPQNRVSLLMGARPHGRDAHYVNPPLEVLAAEYLKAEKQLRIM
jgi:integrase